MLSNKQKRFGNLGKFSKAKMAFAIMLSVVMIVAMTPNLAPVAMYADETGGAATEGSALPESGVGQSTPEGEQGGGTEAVGEEGSQEPASYYSVTFVLPAGYSYGDGSDRFTVSVRGGESVAPVSIPVVTPTGGDVFNGWQNTGVDIILTPEQIANQPVNADTEYLAYFEESAEGQTEAPAEAVEGAEGAEGEQANEGEGKKGGISTMETADVDTWAKFWTAVNTASVDEINIIDDFSRTTTTNSQASGQRLPTITRSLKINGNGHRISFGGSSINQSAFMFGSPTSPVTVEVNNLRVYRGGDTGTNTDIPFFYQATPTGQTSTTNNTTNVTLNIKGVRFDGEPLMRMAYFGGYGLVRVGGYNDNGTWIPTEWKHSGGTGGNAYGKFGVYAQRIEFTEGVTDLKLGSTAVVVRALNGSAYIKALPGSDVRLENTRTDLAGFTETGGYGQCLWFDNIVTNNKFEVENATMSGISHSIAQYGYNSGAFNFNGTPGSFSIVVKNGGKIYAKSTGAMAAFVSNVQNCTFDLTGEGSLLDCLSYQGRADYVGTLRFRELGNQTFNVTDNAVLNVVKGYKAYVTPSDASPYTQHYTMGVALRFGMGANNTFKVNSGGKVYLKNEGNGRYYDPSVTGATNGGYNAAIEFGAKDFTFEVKDKDSVVSLISDYGAALNSSLSGGRIDIRDGATFIARGHTATNAGAVFRVVGGQNSFYMDNPLYYDFRNDRNTGLIFSTGSTSTFESKNSDLSVWLNGTDHEATPYRSWLKIDYKLTGANFGTIDPSSQFPGEFNSSNDSYGNMSRYSRMSANNAAVTVEPLYSATNADQYIRANVKVPEGVDGVRGAWDDEVYADIRVTPYDGSTPYTVRAVSLDEDYDYDGERIDGLLRFKVDNNGFLRTGDKYQIIDAWKGSADHSDPTSTRVRHVDQSDLPTGAVTVTDMTPPTAPTITEPANTYVKGRTEPLRGTYAVTEPAYNRELTQSIQAKILRVNGTIQDLSGTATRNNGIWTYALPPGVDDTLKAGDKIYITAKDTNGNENPVIENVDFISQRDVTHDATFYVAPFVIVTEGPGGLTKNVVDASGQNRDSLTVSGDTAADIKFRLTSKMPENMSSIGKIELHDVMDVGLELKGNSTGESVNVPAVGGVSPTDITWNPVTRTVKVIYEGLTAAQKTALEDETITINITANFVAASDVYPASYTNGGVIYVEGEPGVAIAEADKPVVNLKGKISGRLFDDNDGDGVYGSGDTAHFGTLKLYKETSPDVFTDTGITAVANQDGTYAFTELDDGAYKVFAPKDSAKGYTTMYPYPMANGDYSNVGTDGYTPGFVVNHAAGGINLSWTVNAGYVTPTVTPPGEGTFTKKLVSVGGTNTSGPITNSQADLVYHIDYKMPANTAGYNSLEMQDVMSPGLVLKNNDLANFRVEIDGQPVAGGVKTYTQGTGQDAGNMVASFKFPENYNYGDIAGKTVKMIVTSRLAQVGGNWPTNVRNQARVIVNDSPITPPPPTEQLNTGRIYGVAFADTDRNGAKNGSETGLSGVGVTLKKWDGSEYIAYTPTSSDTAITISNGEYNFYVPEGTYQLEFPTPHNGQGITTTGPNNVPVSGIVTGINIALGDATVQTREVNVGYNTPGTTVTGNLEASFSKQIWDPELNNGAGAYTNTRSITNSQDELLYQIKFSLPAPITDLKGFSSIEIRDEMPNGLTLAEGAGNVTVTVGNQTIYTSAASGTGAQTGHTATYTFNAEALEALIASGASGVTVAMTVKAKLEKVNGVYPPTVTNNGAMYINKANNAPPAQAQPSLPPATVKDGVKIEGTLWYDANGNRAMDGGESNVGSGKTVQLYSGVTLIATATTDNNGKFTFTKNANNEPIPAGSYTIQYPSIEGYAFVTTATDGGANTTNVANSTGLSRAITADLDANQNKISNAGYSESVFIDPSDPTAFIKKITSVTGTGAANTEGSQATTTAPQTDVVNYEISLKMPDDMFPYSTTAAQGNKVIIRDLMGTGLAPSVTPTSSMVSVKNTNTGVAVGGLTPQVAINNSGVLTVEFSGPYANVMQRLENTTVTIAVPARVQASNGVYPDSVKNTADIFLNDATAANVEAQGEPEVFVKGKISGVLFNDLDKNGVYGGNDTRVSGVGVKLYKEGVDTGLIATTSAVGAYEFTGLLPGNYRILAPKDTTKGYTAQQPLATATGSHVGNTGYSYDLVIDRASNGANLEKTANAGYTSPNPPGGGGITKTLVSVGGQPANGPITDSEADLVYHIDYTMPDNAAGYNSLVIQDVMNQGLVLKDNNMANFSVEINGQPVPAAAGSKTYAAGTGVDAGTMIASYRFADDFDFTTIEGQTVRMIVTSRLERVNGEWPTSVTNVGRAIVNDEVIVTPPTTGNNKGRIYGVAFSDTDFNGAKNGVEAGIPNVNVTLKKLNTGTNQYEAYAPTTSDTAITDANGNYNYYVPTGTYRLEFPTPVDSKGITTSAPHAPASGIVEGIVINLDVAGSQTREINAGYNAPNPPTHTYMIDSFIKEVKNGSAYISADHGKTVTDFTEVLEYKVSFKLPRKANAAAPDPAAGLSSVRIEDVLGDGLTAQVAGTENVEVYVGNTKVDIGSARKQTGKTIGYTFDADAIQTYLSGKTGTSADLEVYMIVKADLVQVAGDWVLEAKDTASLTVNAKSAPDKTDELTVDVAGLPPVIEFQRYPLVLSQSPSSYLLTEADLKMDMTVTDDVDTGLLAAPATPGAKGTTATPVGLSYIDRHNIGVYKVSYTATDSHGKVTTRTRAIVVTDGRYAIGVTDDNNDSNDIIIGARNFVTKSSFIDGSMQQARSWSYAEAFNGVGDQMQVTWTGAPQYYVQYTAQTATPEGSNYEFIWQVPGYSTTKTIRGTVVNADQIYPGGKSEQYAISANNFLRTQTSAAAMTANTSAIDSNLIGAASAAVYKLVDDTNPDVPGNQPLLDRDVVVISRGDDVTGPFSSTLNTYAIDYGIQGLLSHHVTINGVVSNGMQPILTVLTPDEVALGSSYASRYLNNVSAIDPDGDKHGTIDPSDDTATDITGSVKYGTLVGSVFTEGTPVNTASAGTYTVDYRVDDSDGNRVSARRVVAVNDGSIVVGTSNLLKANSFVTKLSEVTTSQVLSDVQQELRIKTGATAINGNTGVPFDLENSAVTVTSGYGPDAGTGSRVYYPITITAPDPIQTNQSKTISKSVRAKVVDADELEVGPNPANPTDASRYYVYGKHAQLTTSEAQAIIAQSNVSAAAYETALLNALKAHADKVSPNGDISDANARVSDYGNFNTANGIYYIKVKDNGTNAEVLLRATVSTGDGPTIKATPVPLVIPVTGTSGNLTTAQLFSGVTVTDPEDTNDEELAWNALPAQGPQVTIDGGNPTIKANEKSVTQVTYRYTDADGNPNTISRAIVVDDGRYLISNGAILEANSFIIGSSEVNATNPDPQILEKSNAKAWRLDGTPMATTVVDRSGYSAEPREWGVIIGINGSSLAKQIQARVIDDSNPPGGGGSEGENGDRYSILANNFRVNLTDARAWQGESTAVYNARFLTNSDAKSFLRATQQSYLVQSGTVELESVRRLNDQGNPTAVDFKTASFAEGNKFLATFRITEEPTTKVGIIVLVSDGSAPRLDVPASKVVPVGAAFPAGAQDDTTPSYYQGVYVSDNEDEPAIPYTAVSYTNTVDTSTEGVYVVTYSVTDSDHNTTTQKGVVLVGDWPNPGEYAINAHDFDKEPIDVAGTQAEVIAESDARAVDLRQTIGVSPNVIPNPNYGGSIPVTVKNDGGYYSKEPGEYNVTVAVAANDAIAKTIKAKIGQGSGPVIAFQDYPLVLSQSPESQILSESNLKTGMTVIDPEEGNLLAAPAIPGAKGTTATPVGVAQINRHNIGVYKVSYTARDSHGNSATRTRSVVITDGRYLIDVTDDGDDTNDIIIGARNFVIKARAIDGSMQQARSWSYAEAFDGDGNAKDVTWTGAPAGYVQYNGQTVTIARDYDIIWQVAGFSATKTIRASVVNADEVYPADRNEQYTISANNFLRNVAQATTMTADTAIIDSNLIGAASATVYKLVDDTDPDQAGPQPLPDRGIVVISRGDNVTGPFGPTPNTYPIDYGIQGLISHHVTINGLVSDGQAPILTVATPDEVAQNSAYDHARYMGGVSATDPDGDKKGTPDPSDDTATDITDLVRYGTLTGATFTEGLPVNTANAGLYTVDYRVTDADGNRADKRRVVTVNDGGFVVGTSNILKANSFVTKLSEVTSDPTNIKQELRIKTGATAINGSTGVPFDLDNNAITATGGYTNAADTYYPVTVTAPDPVEGNQSKTISKNVRAKVVDADELEVGPSQPNPVDLSRYYVYGRHVYLTTSEAQAIAAQSNVSAAAYETAMLTALDAHADKVLPNGNIENAVAKVTDYGNFNAANGIYYIKVRDSGNNAEIQLMLTVASGNSPTIAVTPVPLVIEATGTSGNLTDAQIFGGVTVKDVEDTNDEVTAWDALPAQGPKVTIDGGKPTIKAYEKSVTQVTYRYTDADGNPAVTSRAIVVDDGRYLISNGAILEANSFIIGSSEVNSTNPNPQILEKSDAKAWRLDGTPMTPTVIDRGSYSAMPQGYNVKIGINGNDLWKQIEARVIDDSNPPGGGGSEGGNGDRYSIQANNFRINLTDARVWQGESGATYDGRFLTNSKVATYLRASSTQATLVAEGSAELESIRKQGAPAVDFKTATLAQGDVFLATFRVAEEPDTKVTIAVLVSDANVPVLTVPAFKTVLEGAAFPVGTPNDTTPSYYQGVSATDVEDPAITYTAISYTGTVDTSADGAYTVVYSVTDSDHNTVTKAGVVLVGDWDPPIDGYSIKAHDFTKQPIDVAGTEAEVISESGAVAVDLRQYLGTAPNLTLNPDIGKLVPVKVSSDGGYYSKEPGEYDVVIAVRDRDTVTKTIKAKIDKGNGPAIAFTDYPLIFTQSQASHELTDTQLRSRMTVTDAEDGNILAGPATAGAKGTTYEIRQGGDSGSRVANIDTQNIGVYKVIYTARDSHGNTETRARAIVVTDGRYTINVTDDGNDNNDIIIGARDFVIASEQVDGSETQARGRSYAEAYDGDGDARTVTWTGAPTTPSLYRAKAPAGDYTFTWRIEGSTATKTSVGHVTNATVVDPGTKDSQYGLTASNFRKSTAEAIDMITSGDISNRLIEAASAKVIKLVSSAPNAAVGVVSNGDAVTGPFSAALNTYPIRFGIVGHDANEFKAIISGVVSDGDAPVLTVVPVPLEVWTGVGAKPAAAIDPAVWNANNKYGVTVNDPDEPTLGVNDVTITQDSDTVDTAKPGVYKLTYSVTDSAGNTVTARRTVTVNDGSYTVGAGRILKANSFEINKDAVVTSPVTLKNAQLKSLSSVTLYDGTTGNVIDDTSVGNDGGYSTYTVGEAFYNVTFRGVDPAEGAGYVSKTVVGHVVDAKVIEGPGGPDTGGDVYYAYGDDITISVTQAQGLNTDAKILDALHAHIDKVSPGGAISTIANSDIDVDVKPLVPVKSLSGGDTGVYEVEISDAGNNAKIKLTIVVSGGGGSPVITAPNPVVIPVDPDNHSGLGKSDLMAGVSADDPDEGDLTASVKINPGNDGNDRIPAIPADEEGVYSVTYFVKDADGNEDAVTTAVIVDGGSFVVGHGYIVKARSFIINLSEVTPEDPKGQILARSDAEAWNTKGEPATAVVNDTSAYTNVKGDHYFPTIGVQGIPQVEKNIQVSVVDDTVPGSGSTGSGNGDRYSITADTFRINLAEATALAGQGGTAYSGVFIGRSSATGYLRTGTGLVKNGVIELAGNVVKEGNASKNFTTAGFAEGDIYLATYRVSEDPEATVTAKVIVSNGNPPTLTVPTSKEVSVGAIFGPVQYMQDVSAIDSEDGPLGQDRISHNSPVDTTTKGAYKVTYSVRDDENNLATKAGMVLVGDWKVIDGYGIEAEDFTKLLSDVTGTEAEAVTYANARALDLRDMVFDGTKMIPNPDFGAPVVVIVADDGGYYGKATGTFNITFAVKDKPTATTTVVAKVGAGDPPIINLPAYKLIKKGDQFAEGSRYDSLPSYMQGVYAVDAEDGIDTLPVYHNSPVAPGVDGNYKVTYNVTDSDQNYVTRAGIVLVGPWVPGTNYGIIAYPFSKNLGQVTGTTADMVNSAQARAIDLRLTLANGQPNPAFGNAVPVTVSNNGGYTSRTVGNFNITFAVQAEPTTTITIAASVGAGAMPTLNVPDVKVVPAGAAFGEAQYMQGVSATDPEDGTITARVAHDSLVNTGVEGYYAVSYSATDNDSNTARRTGIVLVGNWTVVDGHAIIAYDFSLRAGQVRGTDSEMLDSARVQAICVDSNNPNFGKVVQAVVQSDGGYTGRTAGAYAIRFGVQAAPGATKTITASVGGGNAPVIVVPSVRTVPDGSGFSYMAGVVATDAEDGVITGKVIYNTPVNTNAVGAYKVTYTVTDSDGNTTVKPGIALVGRGWVVSGGYALYAQDFALKLSATAGTRAEATRLAKAMAVWVADTSNPDYGKYVPITILDRGSYRKAVGNFNIVFAVAESRSVIKTITASVSDDAPKAPVTNTTNNTTTTPAPNVVVNTPAAEPAPTPEPVIVEVPTPVTPEAAPEITDTPIEPEEVPLAAPVESKGEWHLIDLLLVILTMALGLYLMAYAMRRRDEYDVETTSRGMQIRMWGQLGVLLGLVSVVALLLTQKFLGDMKIIDVWSALFGVILGIEILALIGVTGVKNREWEVEREV